jgi:hypothetical protein
VCPLTLLNITTTKPNFTSWNYPSVSLRHDRVASSFGIKKIRYLENTPGELLHRQFRALAELHKKRQQWFLVAWTSTLDMGKESIPTSTSPYLVLWISGGMYGSL